MFPNFIRPGLKGKEPIGLLFLMVVIPFAIWGLTFAFGFVEKLWTNIYSLHVISEKVILIAKAILVLLVAPIFIIILNLKSWQNKQSIRITASNRWLIFFTLMLLLISPAIVSCIILGFLFLCMSVLAIKYLVTIRR